MRYLQRNKDLASPIDNIRMNVVGDPGGGGSGDGNNSGFGGRGAQKTLGQSLKKLAGIDLGIAAMLKQSQIFTGYLGNIFAIVGALIDTILAPLAPIAFKALADIGKKWLPAAQKFFEKNIPKVVSFLGAVVKGIDSIGKFISKDWAKWMAAALATLIGIRMAVAVGGATGRFAGNAIGLRGGFLSQGIGLMRGGGGAATGMRVIAQGSATRGAPMALQGAQGAGRLARFGGAARVLGGGAGGLIGGITGYTGGRAQGMSQGRSVGRGVASGVGGAAGAALLSPLGPAGMAIGGMAGSAMSAMLFDKMFGDKSGKAGGRTDESGQIGLAGYSAPMVVASAAQKFSDNIEESGQILSNSVMKHADGIDEAAKVPPHVMEEMKKMVQEDIDSVKGFHRAALADMAAARKIVAEIHGTAGKPGDLSFARGAGAASIRSSAPAIEYQAKQIVNELKHEIIDKSTYGIARSLGFGGDTKVTQTGGRITLTDPLGGEGGEAKQIDLNITFGGADGSQQILRGEQNGKQIFIKMEEDVSGWY